MKRRMGSRVLLGVAGVGLALAAGEVGLRVGMRHLPVRLHGFFDEGIRVLAQGTKRGLVPRDYIALVGDSHALGMGDGFGERETGEAWFGLASVLHARLGRDVITFGASGAGSLRGVATEPVVGLAVVNATAGLRMEPPETIVVVFYEGNDLNDNLVDLMQRYKPTHDPERLQDEEYFRSFIANEIVAKDALNPRAHPRGVWRHSLLLSFFGAQLFPDRVTQAVEAAAPAFWQQDSNRVVVGGAVVAIPGHLQGPGLELSEEEILLGGYVFEQALATLRGQFAGSRVVVLYVPSVLTCYTAADATVSTESYHFREMIYPAGKVAVQSERIWAEVSRACGAQGVVAIDGRVRLRAAAAGELVHGPRDWFHFNRKGYAVLGEALVAGL